MVDFDDIQIGYYGSSHVNNYYEVDSDDGTLKYYTFTTTSTSDAYILVGFYNQRMYPYSCKTDDSTGSMALYNYNSGATVFSNASITD